MSGRNQELKFEIINQIGVISTSASGWNVELNRVSWNGNEPKYDVRSWSPDHTKMGKGITFSEEELVALSELLAKEVEFLKED
ncbi:MAG: YdbC family protein [Christensenellales bacterium]